MVHATRALPASCPHVMEGQEGAVVGLHCSPSSVACQTFVPPWPAPAGCGGVAPYTEAARLIARCAGPVCASCKWPRGRPTCRPDRTCLGSARCPARRALSAPAHPVPRARWSSASVAPPRRGREREGAPGASLRHVWQAPTFRQPFRRHNARSPRLRIGGRVPSGLFSRPADA